MMPTQWSRERRDWRGEDTMFTRRSVCVNFVNS